MKVKSLLTATCILSGIIAGGLGSFNPVSAAETFEVIGYEDVSTSYDNIEDLEVLLNNKEIVEEDILVTLKQPNTLIVSLSDTSVDFGEVLGTEDVEKTDAINLTISSSLPYDVNLKATDDIKGNNDGTNKIDISKLGVMLNKQSYKVMTKDYLTLVSNEPKGVDVVHTLDFKLSSTLGAKADSYYVPLKLNVMQK